MNELQLLEQDIMRYDATTRKLYGSLFLKALKFVNLGCIHYIGDNHSFLNEGKAFICGPINQAESFTYDGIEYTKKPHTSHYNNTTYIITITYNPDLRHINLGDGNFFRCSCQGWKDKDDAGACAIDGVHCSHSLALKLYFKMRSYANKIKEFFTKKETGVATI